MWEWRSPVLATPTGNRDPRSNIKIFHRTYWDAERCWYLQYAKHVQHPLLQGPLAKIRHRNNLLLWESVCLNICAVRTTNKVIIQGILLKDLNSNKHQAFPTLHLVQNNLAKLPAFLLILWHFTVKCWLQTCITDKWHNRKPFLAHLPN